MRGDPQFSFWILITLVEICFSRIFIKPRKNTFELVGTVLKAISLFSTTHLVLRITLRLRRWRGFTPAICRKATKAAFWCLRAFKYNHDNFSRLRRCCFGTRPSSFAEMIILKLKWPLHSVCNPLIIVLGKKEHGDP